MLGRGNSKLGPKVRTWSIPAIVTCPGATDYCRSVCYADRHRYRSSKVIDALQRNLDQTLESAEWARSMSEECSRLPKGTAVRIHVSGDYHTAPYARAWAQIARQNPHVRFYGYTRSHRVPRLAKALEALRSEPNVYLWASTDPDAPDPPEGWHEARIFPTADEAREAGFVVCPEQTGAKDSCSDCGLCWRPRQTEPVRLGFVEH